MPDEEKFDLDRETNIANNIDANGKKWRIKRSKQTGMFWAEPLPYRSDYVCPKEFPGMWTKPDTLQERITLYVTRTWDMADKKKVKEERVAQAAKENKNK